MAKEQPVPERESARSGEGARPSFPPEKIRLLTDSLPAFIAYIDSDQRYGFVNRHYERLGFGPLQGRHIREVLGERDYEFIRPYVERALEGETATWQNRVRLLGRDMNLQATYVPHVESGRVRGFFSLITDIMDQKQTEELLREREARLRKQNAVLVSLARNRALEQYGLDEILRTILEAAADTLVVERASLWLYATDREKIVCRDLYERSQNRHSSGQSLAFDRYPSYFRALEEERTLAAHDAANDPRTREFLDSYLRPLGIASMLDAPLWVNGRMAGVLCHEHVGPARTWTEDEQQFAAAIADLATLAIEGIQHRQTEKILSDTERLFRAVFESALDAILIADDQGRYVSANPAACRLLGLDEKQLLGRPISDFLQTEKDFSALWKTLIAEGQMKGEIRLERPDGEIREAEFCATAHIMPGRHLSVLRDITERKKTERELHRSNAELQQFAYVVSHDLQAPLSRVLGHLRLVCRRHAERLDPEAREFLSTALEETQRMKILIKDLLDYSLIGPPDRPLRPVDCDALWQKAENRLGREIEEAGARIRRGPLPTLWGDEHQLERLFVNLLSNAVKFRGERPPEVRIRAERAGREWQFCVEDNGVGIPPEQRDRVFTVFQRFQPDKHPGTGVGLAVCKKVVEQHGGRIWLESEPDRGSRFFFTLPAHEPAAMEG